MKDNQYAFCVARIRALENKLLTKQDISALVNQKDYHSAFDFLLQKGYPDNEGQDIEIMMKDLGDELHKLLTESVPDKDELLSLYILNDYYNIKVIVKCAVEGVSPEGLLHSPSRIDTSDFDKMAISGDFSFLCDEHRLVAEKAYSIALKSKNGKFSDAIVDRFAITALSSFYKCKKNDLIGKICAFLADTANIKIALRCVATEQDEDFINEAIGECALLDRSKLINAAVSDKEKLISYLISTDYKKGVELYLNSPSAFEKWCDEQIINITDSAKYTSLGFAPVVRYFYFKNLEIKTIRMILSALKSGIDKDIINERVRNIYA